MNTVMTEEDSSEDSEYLQIEEEEELFRRRVDDAEFFHTVDVDYELFRRDFLVMFVLYSSLSILAVGFFFKKMIDIENYGLFTLWSVTIPLFNYTISLTLMEVLFTYITIIIYGYVLKCTFFSSTEETATLRRYWKLNQNSVIYYYDAGSYNIFKYQIRDFFELLICFVKFLFRVNIEKLKNLTSQRRLDILERGMLYTLFETILTLLFVLSLLKFIVITCWVSFWLGSTSIDYFRGPEFKLRSKVGEYPLLESSLLAVLVGIVAGRFILFVMRKRTINDFFSGVMKMLCPWFKRVFLMIYCVTFVLIPMVVCCPYSLQAVMVMFLMIMLSFTACFLF